MEEIARVYSGSLFEVGKDAPEAGALDEIHDQLGEFADALAQDRELTTFFFSPYFSSAEKKEGLAKAVSGADPRFLNFLELLIEKHRMPAIFRIRHYFDHLWAEERKRLEVTVTSAVALDPQISEQIGAEIERQTGRSIELSSRIDPDILGGLVVQVGNMVLDASVANRLDKLRKQVAHAA